MRWLIGAVLFSICMGAQADVPRVVHYNGYLTNAVGEAVDCADPFTCDENINLTFRLYAGLNDDAAIWQGSHAAVAIYMGQFHVVLGTETVLSDVLFEQDLWLGVEVNANGEMAPRQRITAAPFAIRAGSADQAAVAANATQLGGIDAAEFEPGPSFSGSFNDLSDTPEGLANGDDDTLADMVCAAGMVAKYNGSAWGCANDESGAVDTTLTEADVDLMVANNDFSTGAHTVDTTLTEEEVDAMVANNGFSTGDHTVDTTLTEEEVDSMVANNDFSTGAHTVDTTLTEEEVDAMVANNDYASAADLNALQGSLAPVAASGSFGDLSGVPAGLADGDDDTDTLGSLTCAEGEVAQFDGSSWACTQGSNTFATVMPGPCDESAVGKSYFDTVGNALRICDGTAYRKVKLCSELCPDAAAVACNQAVEDDCGTICGGTGTGLNLLLCNSSVVSCGQPVQDACGNDCGTTGTALDLTTCAEPLTITCGAPVIDACGNECGGTGTLCPPIAPNCSVGVCVENFIVASGTGRGWSDATYASSCSEYLNPPSTYTYEGLTGSGVYTVDTGGEVYDVYCDMTTDGGGWTLAINNTMGSSWVTSFDQGLEQNGFMRAFDSMTFTDVLVKFGPIHTTQDWVSFHGVGNTAQTYAAKIASENLTNGSGSPRYQVTHRSPSLATTPEVEFLRLRQYQNEGPNDGMLLTVGRDSCSWAQSERSVSVNCLAAQLAFGEGNNSFSSWENTTNWDTGCSRSGYRNGTDFSCTGFGGHFIR